MLKADRVRLRFYLLDSDIYSYYFGGFNIGNKVRSPFRRDSVPSLIFYTYNDSVKWRDYGLSTQEGNDPVAFVMHLFDVTEKEACNMIWEEMVEGCNIPKRKKTIDFKKQKIPLVVTTKELEDFELEYWNRAMVKKPLLDFYKIKSVASASISDINVFESVKGDPAFYYTFSDGAFKTYRPLTNNKSAKFRGKGNGKVMEGWEQLPFKGQHLIINKSLKDTIVCRNIGILSTNPTGEGSIDYIRTKIREINARFTNVYILFDPDKAGIAASNALHKDTGWPQIYLDKEKDCFDNVCKYNNYFYLNNFFKPLNLHYYGIRN